MLKELDRVLTMAAMLSDDEDEDVNDVVLMRSITSWKRFECSVVMTTGAFV